MSSDYEWPDQSKRFAVGEALCDGRFKVLQYVGTGSIASGWQCEDALLRERIVCKIAHAEKDSEHLRLQYLKLHQLRSDGIARVHGLFRHNEFAVIALEAIDGEDFGPWWRKSELNERFSALIQIAGALGDLHQQGIYHGDFKGGTNIRKHTNRGCVFIDPEPDTAGSRSPIADDLSDLAELIELLLPDYASRYFKKTFQRLKGNDYTAKDVAVDLTAVRDSRHLPGNLDQIKLDAANYSAKRAKTDQQYKWNRENRAAAIERLKENIDELARYYIGLTTTLHLVDLKRETDRDTSGLGYFVGRTIQCKTSAQKIHFP